MSDSEDEDFDFGYHDNERSVPDGPDSRPPRRVLAAAAGLAALVAGGAFVASEIIRERPPVIATDSGALASLAPPSVPAAASSAGAPPTAPGATAGAAASSAADQAVRDARRAAARHGVKVLRPRVTSPVTAADVTVTETGSRKDGSTLRVVSARGDLTGQRELGWVAGGTEAYGDATCSQTVQFTSGLKPAKRTNLLICWRTSPARSVVTVLVDPHGHPSRAASVAALDKRWNQLG